MKSSRAMVRFFSVGLVWLSTTGLPLMAQQQSLPFFPRGTYQASVPTPESILGFPVGSRPARYEEAVRYLSAVAAKSDRVKLFPFGQTAEGRTLYYIVVSSPENIGRLEVLRENNAKLADPGKTGAEGTSKLVESSPAFVWAGYAIHGDEVSSVDAALQILYQLSAGTDSVTMKILHETVIAIDPIVNPDGRERFLSQMQQWNGKIPNPDAQSLHHTGTWPYGRGNHYLFDLNRDWVFLVNAEMQERVRAVVGWMPQVMIDSHEMDGGDTYLFSPPREPLNPNISPVARHWWKVFAADQAKAFDQYGWSYYTREWNDDWYPGYGASWPLYLGAVGILYEQAGVEGSVVKRSDGTTLTYREAIHHHFTSSIANFGTAANHRKDLLADYVAARRNGVPAGTHDPRSFYVVPGPNPTRTDALVERLLMSGIEVTKIGQQFTASDLVDCSGNNVKRKTLPAGTYVISVAQPMGRLAKALLETDPRMSTAVLAEERKSLEKDKDSRMYDVTAWSLLLAYGVEAYWSPGAPAAAGIPVLSTTAPAGQLEDPDASYGFLMSCSDDREVEALAAILRQGFHARGAKEPFTIGGNSYGRGSILLRRNENPPAFVAALKAIAETSGVRIRGIGTALASAGVDLGGNDMVLLQEPRVALVAGPEISSSNFGWIWHLLEERLRMRVSLVTVQTLGYADLGKYNVLVLPSGDSRRLIRTMGKEGVARLRSWIEAGGTLVAESGAAAFVADSSTGLSNVRLRQQALKDLGLYATALELERKAREIAIDSAALWSGKGSVMDTTKPDRTSSMDEKLLALQEERARVFAPRGAILQVTLDPEHWLAYGMGKSVPVMVATSLALLSRDPVQTPGRFADGPHLRFSGLLWPEARERIAGTAYATRERRGRGQIILFAGEPVFRGGFRDSERLLINAILLGPGFGATAGVPW
jgi:Zinc carboxypeptidase